VPDILLWAKWTISLSLGPNGFKTRKQRSRFLSVETVAIRVRGPLELSARAVDVSDPEQE
jgi:hypothetical protein